MVKGILYACIAERNEQSDFSFVLAGDCPANSPVINTVKMILPRINSDSHKRTLTQSSYHFHYKVNDSHCYLCVTEAKFPVRITYAFLDDIEAKYLRTNTKKIRNLLRDCMTHFNDTKNDKIISLQEKIDHIKDVMTDNLETLIENQEKIEVLVDQSQDLQESTALFKKGSNKIKWSMRKRIALIAAVLVTIVFFITAAAVLATMFGICGPTFEKCPRPTPEPSPTSTDAPFP